MIPDQYHSLIQQAFAAAGVEYVQPKMTQVVNLYKGTHGRHRGLYYIYPEMNMYFGKASGPKASIHARFQPHYFKLKAAINKFFQYIPKAAWSFPAGWREGVRRFLLDPASILPEPQRRGTVHPDAAAFQPQFKNGINVDAIPVAIWDLSHLTDQQISAIEKNVLRGPLNPFCNTETHRLRLKGKI
ncbi:MAG: hypothetical protein N2235_10575 [Fischerella sp.]|nr:hypothetical protein [Fischerella sp.]